VLGWLQAIRTVLVVLGLSKDCQLKISVQSRKLIKENKWWVTLSWSRTQELFNVSPHVIYPYATKIISLTMGVNGSTGGCENGAKYRDWSIYINFVKNMPWFQFSWSFPKCSWLQQPHHNSSYKVEPTLGWEFNLESDCEVATWQEQVWAWKRESLHTGLTHHGSRTTEAAVPRCAGKDCPRRHWMLDCFLHAQPPHPQRSNSFPGERVRESLP